MLARLNAATAAVILSSLLYTSFSSTANAACKGVNCACYSDELNFSSPALKPNADGQYPISLDAENVQTEGESVVELSGNAQVQQGRQTIVADSIQYYRDTERVVATGNVEMISEDGDYLSSDSIDVFAPTQIGTLTNTNFKLSEGLESKDGVDTATIQARGTADVVNLEGEGVIRLENAKYSSCPEGNDSVMVLAKELELDRIGGIARARNATVRFKGVPILYTPYISFPINNERKTGFLSPGFGSDQESGSVIEIPWYWNIAKNQDATLTTRYYSDRGVQFGAEYRHRSLNSETLVYGEGISNDELFGDGRDLLTVQHKHQFTDNLSARLNYNDVSDIDYFNDFRNDVSYFGAAFVPRDVRVDYSHDYFRLRARANQYQVIDDTLPRSLTPYERLPSLSLSTRLPDGPWDLEYGLNASYNNFQAGDISRIEGTRLSLSPYVQLPFENVWGYVKPRLSFHNRSYSLDNARAGAEENPSFSVPIFSIDSGISFERNTNWFGDAAIQTLEPRVFYVYAPEEDQSDIPDFDTNQVLLNNIRNIYRENRFFGEDRIGDTNQVTFGLTSRVIDNQSGRERLKFSVGQLYLLDDLEVNLPRSKTIEKGIGDTLVELGTRSGSWETYSFVQYSHEESELASARFSVKYRPKDDARKNLSVGYFFRNGRRTDIDQITFNVNWPLADRWQLFGNGRYSLERSENIASSLGVEYNGCCWKIRVIGSDRLDSRLFRFNQRIENSRVDPEDERRTSIFFEFELTTLGTFTTDLR